MGKEKTNESRFDSNGARMVMRKRDYFADLGLGKTLQIITLLDSLETPRPSLVV